MKKPIKGLYSKVHPVLQNTKTAVPLAELILLIVKTRKKFGRPISIHEAISVITDQL
jgi:hypothetical protein